MEKFYKELKPNFLPMVYFLRPSSLHLLLGQYAEITLEEALHLFNAEDGQTKFTIAAEEELRKF